MTMRTLVLDALPGDVRRARRWVSDQCHHAMHEDDTCDVLSLLVSEVVSNAVVHGTGPVTVELDETPQRLRVTVGDSSSDLPTVKRQRDLAATSGRGLMLVDSLAQAWGVRDSPSGSGKHVWFAVGLPQDLGLELRTSAELTVLG